MQHAEVVIFIGLYPLYLLPDPILPSRLRPEPQPGRLLVGLHFCSAIHFFSRIRPHRLAKLSSALFIVGSYKKRPGSYPGPFGFMSWFCLHSGSNGPLAYGRLVGGTGVPTMVC